MLRSAILAAILAPLAFLMPSIAQADGCQLKITSPADDSVISLNEQTKGGHVQLTVNIDIAKCPLAASDKVTVFVKVLGGDTFWVSGSQIDSIAATGSTSVRIGFVTLGKPKDGNSEYEITAGVTSEALSAGTTLKSLPKDTRGQNKIYVKKAAN